MQKVSSLRLSCPSFDEFACLINPDTQVQFAADERKTIMDDYSTLEVLDTAYGNNAVNKWLVAALANVNEFAGSKSMDDEQTEKLAKVIAQEYKGMKYSVMQLFFYRFKCGYFGKFYGKVDPMVITCALKDFSDECFRKQQEYLNEEFQERERKEQEERTKIYQDWYTFVHELSDEVADIHKKDILGITIDKFFVKDLCIRIETTQEQYMLLERMYYDKFSAAFSKYFPDYRIQYRIAKSDGRHTAKQAESSRKAILALNEKTVALSSARSVVDNIYHLDDSGLVSMRDAFRKRYGLFPDEYISKYGKGNQ